MRRFLLAITAVLLSNITLHTTVVADEMQCVEVNRTIQCRMLIPDFLHRIRATLTNGWENTLDFHISLINNNGETLKSSQLTATQRCYIDPFESPCLILWSGSADWLTYPDEAQFLKALARLRLIVFKLQTLPPGNYRVQTIIRLNTVTAKQANKLRSWLRFSGQTDTTVLGNNSTSILGNFMNTFTHISEGTDEASTTLSTSSFYIDLNAVSPQEE